MQCTITDSNTTQAQELPEPNRNITPNLSTESRIPQEQMENQPEAGHLGATDDNTPFQVSTGSDGTGTIHKKSKKPIPPYPITPGKICKRSIYTLRTILRIRTRVGRNPHLVNKYGKMLMAGKEVPKVILYVTENGVQFVTSGFDVIRGAKLINRRMIDVEIRHGSQTDAYKEILAANKSNSSRFTDDEKRTTAYRAMDVYSDRSNTEIAELCGIEVSRIEEERKEYQKYLSRTSVNIESNTDNSQGHSPQASKSPEQTLPIHDSGGKASSGESPTEDSDGSSGPSIPAKKEVVADIGNQDSEGQSSVDETNISDMPSPSVRLFTTPQSETITALSAFETTIQKGICYDLIVIKAAASDAVKKLGAIRSILQPNACVVVRMAVSDLPQIIRSFGGHLEFVGVVGFAPPDLSDNQSEHQKLKTDFLFIKGHCKSRDRFSSVAFLGCIGNGAEQIYRYVAQVLGEDAPVKPLALSRHALNQFLMDEEGHRGHPTRKAKLAHRAWLI